MLFWIMIIFFKSDLIVKSNYFGISFASDADDTAKVLSVPSHLNLKANFFFLKNSLISVYKQNCFVLTGMLSTCRIVARFFFITCDTKSQLTMQIDQLVNLISLENLQNSRTMDFSNFSTLEKQFSNKKADFLAASLKILITNA